MINAIALSEVLRIYFCCRHLFLSLPFFAESFSLTSSTFDRPAHVLLNHHGPDAKRAYVLTFRLPNLFLNFSTPCM
jgi:hypothetical protein